MKKLKSKRASLRSIPAVERVLQQVARIDLPRAVVTAIVRRELTAMRSTGKVPPEPAAIQQITQTLRNLERLRIQPVINGTGVLIHTNLGRVPLARVAIESMTAAAAYYNNLEYDLNAGTRGARADYLETCLALLCHADAATAVNNGAAALLLVLRHLIDKKTEVVISRGELVQIGGGFRIPEILESSGAKLREVGTTNKTTLNDYAKAIGPGTALLLKVHRSNFFMDGFVASPPTSELAALARRKRVPFVEDLGSGAILATERFAGVEHEPTPAEVLRQGVDLVCFSGDKLFGGPQAGIVAGKARWLTRLKKEPLFRALRCDKIILAGLQATAELYLTASEGGSSFPALPVYTMMSASMESLQSRAACLRKALQNLPLHTSIGSAQSKIGGGTLPRSSMESVTLDLMPEQGSAQQLAACLRLGQPPVVGYLSGRLLRLDLRTIFPEQDETLEKAIRQAVIDRATRVEP